MATTDSNAIQQSKSVATDSNAKQQSKSVYVENPEELKKIFDQFDANKDGKISLAELAAVLKSMGSAYTDDELRRVMDDLDNDKDGFINLSEFSTLCRSSSDASGEAEIHDAFDLYDQDKNALISSKELHLILNKLGMKYSVDECVRMIQSVDSDGDGNVNFEEFKKMMATSVNCSSGP